MTWRLQVVKRGIKQLRNAAELDRQQARHGFGFTPPNEPVRRPTAGYRDGSHPGGRGFESP